MRWTASFSLAAPQLGSRDVKIESIGTYCGGGCFSFDDGSLSLEAPSVGNAFTDDDVITEVAS